MLNENDIEMRIGVLAAAVVPVSSISIFALCSISSLFSFVDSEKLVKFAFLLNKSEAPIRSNAYVRPNTMKAPFRKQKKNSIEYQYYLCTHIHTVIKFDLFSNDIFGKESTIFSDPYRPMSLETSSKVSGLNRSNSSSMAVELELGKKTSIEIDPFSPL